MTKEMIISANVHEKKVAIIEDGFVTEFYVERSDENQGVVGNIYKGRVMKVLPGMQSAFVDIGLERDAFLYVSDFTDLMEEEEAIDVRELQDEPRPEPRSIRSEARKSDARERIPEPSLPIGRQPPAPAESVEAPVPFEDAVEQLAEIADERVIPEPVREEGLTGEYQIVPAEAGTEAAFGVIDFEQTSPESLADVIEEEAPEPRGRRSRGRRKSSEVTKTRRGRKGPEDQPVSPDDLAAKKRLSKGRLSLVDEEALTPPPIESAVFYEEPPSPAPWNEGASDSQIDSASSFERVTDEELAQDAGELLKDALVQERIIERVHNAEYRTGQTGSEPEPEWRVGRINLAEESSFQRVVDETSNEPALPRQTPGESEASVSRSIESDDIASAAEESEKTATPMRHVSDFLPRSIFDRFRAKLSGSSHEGARRTEPGARHQNEMQETDTPTTTESTDEGRSEYGRQSPVQETDDMEAETRRPADHAAGDLDDWEDADSEASVRDRGGRAEFAVRRGGRGRRRRREPAPVTEEEKAHAEKQAAPTEQAESQTATGEEQQAAAPVTEQPAPGSEQRIGPPSPAVPEGHRARYRRSPVEIPVPQRKPERLPPTISELLHESQEILVQIAKEPIARKGARITSHIALPGRYLVYMPTVNHIGVSRKIGSEIERIRLKRTVTSLRDKEGAPGGFIVRTACAGHTEQELADDMRYLIRTWSDIRRKSEQTKAPTLVHRDLDLVQRILRDHLSDEFSAIHIDNEIEYTRMVEFVNRIQPKLIRRVKLYTGGQPILEKYGVQPEIDKAVKPRVWLKSGGYIVINQTEALVAIDVNTGKFVGKSDRLEDTITRTNLDAVKEIVRQVRLRDLGGIIVVDFIDMEERRNRQRVMAALQQELQADRAPSKILSINDFGLVAITRKRVKQSLERTLCTPCPYCQGAGMVKSPQTVCFEILEQAKAIAREVGRGSDVTLRVSPEVAEAFRSREREVWEETEAYFPSGVTLEVDPNLHREHFDFAVV